MKDYQKILFPYAYNILGSVDDANDAIQDVLTKYITFQREGIENEKSYLTKSVINQSINLRKKRKSIRNEDVWLPEPVATEETDANLHFRDIASYSMLVLLEQLNPKERAVFILKEAFGYSHEEIAEVLSSTVENARKLLSRAKRKINPAKQSKASVRQNPRFVLVEKYINAIRGRDTKTLEDLLSADIAFFADGGPTLKVVKKHCAGIREVIDLVLFVYHTFNITSSVAFAWVNHQPAVLYYNDAELHACHIFDFSDDNKITRINSILDPEKLKNINIQHQMHHSM